MNLNKKYICKDCSFKELKNIRYFLKENISKYINDDLESNKIILAVDEAVTNLIKHSFESKAEAKINIIVNIQNKVLKIIIEDNGRPFDIRNFKTPDMFEYFKNLNKGGLGVHLIKTFIDDINYISSEKNSNMNKLILSKKLPI